MVLQLSWSRAHAHPRLSKMLPSHSAHTSYTNAVEDHTSATAARPACPLATILNRCLVLSALHARIPHLPPGDPQQLGPVILSPHARRHGMATSLLERLAAGPPYTRREGPEVRRTGVARAGGNRSAFPWSPLDSPYSLPPCCGALRGPKLPHAPPPRCPFLAPAPSPTPNLPPPLPLIPQPYLSTFITRLRDNYRSHPAILEVPNAAFYHGELRPAADTDLTHAVVRNRWSKEHLPNPRWACERGAGLGRAMGARLCVY